MPSTRRSLLVGAAAMLAGCSAGSPRSGTGDGTPGETEPPLTIEPLEFGESATVGELDVRPTGAVVQYSYVALVYPDFADVVAAEGQQYLFLTVDASGSPAPAPEEFAVLAGESSYAGQPRGSAGRPYRDERPYTPDAGHGWLLYDLPVPVESEHVAVELDVGEGEPQTWHLPDDVVERLRGPAPAFEVRDFEAPSVVRPEEPIEVSATVANVGDGRGTFRGSLNQEGDLLYGADTFSFDLEAGEERDWTETVTTHQRPEVESETTVRLRFRSAGGDFDRDVVVRPAGTPGG
jgi:hypothetical protein